MNTIGLQNRVACVIAVALLLQVSAARASGPPDGQVAAGQGSRVPGLPAAETATNRHRGHVNVTFTKWITTSPLMEGFTGGDIPGRFVGEVLERQVSQDGRIIRIEAIYEVQSGPHSFTALIRGGTGETNERRGGQCVGRCTFGRRHPGRMADRRACLCEIPDDDQLRWRTRHPHLFRGHDAH